MQSWGRTLSFLCALADIKHQLKVKAVEPFISLAHDCFICFHRGTLLITSAFIHLELAFRVKKKPSILYFRATEARGPSLWPR